MKHALSVLASLVALAFAAIVIWFNRTALTMSILVFATGCLAIAFALALGSDFPKAIAAIAPYVPLLRGQPPSLPPTNAYGGDAEDGVA